VAALLGALVTALASGSYAIAKRGNGGGAFRATLNGFHETTGGPPTAEGNTTGSVSTTGRGKIRLSVRDDTIHYVLDYEDIEGGDATQAHLHFAERHVAGGVIAFLCGGPRPPCTEPDGRFEGDITAADIIGPADQGIAPGEIDEVIRALRNGAVYANVHSATWPEGEIRGDIKRRGHGHDDD
jgi:hypothetical protein